MNRIWKTHKGDEWWYQDYWCKASASRSAGLVSINYEEIKQGQLTDERLHDFLWISWKKFQGERILFGISNSDVLDVLSRLDDQGFVEFERVMSTYSKEAKINLVKPYESHRINESVQKKKWWQFW